MNDINNLPVSTAPDIHELRQVRTSAQLRRWVDSNLLEAPNIERKDGVNWIPVSLEDLSDPESVIDVTQRMTQVLEGSCFELKVNSQKQLMVTNRKRSS